MLTVLCTVLGIWCVNPTPTNHLNYINSYVVGRNAMLDLISEINFNWDMPCPKSENIDYIPYMKAIASMLNPMQDALPSFLHSMTPSFQLNGNTVIRFSSPSPCTYNLGAGDITVASIIDFTGLNGAVYLNNSTTITMTHH